MELISLCTNVLLGILFMFIVLYCWIRHVQSYWKRRGIDGPKPSFFVGNLGDWFKFKKSFPENFADIYHATKHLPYTGIYMGVRPTLVINDLDFIKKIMIKDFAYFSDHGFDFNYKYEPMAAHLFNVRGEKWKSLRMKLSPAFTTSRIKQMFEIFNTSSETMLEYLETNHEDIVETKEVLCKFTTDVIGKSAFGLECNSFKDPNSEFRTYGKKIVDLPLYRALSQFFVFFFFPSLMRKLPFSVLGKEVNDFFTSIVKKTVDYRENNNITRNDILDLMIQLKNKGELEGDDPEQSENHKDDGVRLSMMELTAQVFGFFFAGFETSSTTGSLALYELALNPDMQVTLAKEIDQVMQMHNGKLTYDAISEMHYLTMVVEETLRKYPTLGVLMRLCTKDYQIPFTDKIIKKDTPVIIPLYGIQHDPAYFPNPNTFDPERFNTENKQKIPHFSYMPFGEGPRTCIGNRLALMQTKVGLASLISKYKFSTCDKTLIPMKFRKRNIVLASEQIWLNIKKRNK